MKYVNFYDLYKMDFELTDLFGMKQKWSKGIVFSITSPRKSNGIIFLKGCAGVYTNKFSETFEAPLKSLVCLPAGSEYTVLNSDCDKDTPDAYLIEFNIEKNGERLYISDRPFLIENVNIYLAMSFMQDIVKAYEASIKSPVALKAAVYRFLSFLGEESSRKFNKKYEPISTGIELLENNMADDLSINDIADACNVSAGCFRKLFKEYSGKSPLQYRLDLKMDMAKKMLESSDIRIETVANALGMDNYAYFCRIFKKKTGMTPSMYKEFFSAKK